MNLKEKYPHLYDKLTPFQKEYLGRSQDSINKAAAANALKSPEEKLAEEKAMAEHTRQRQVSLQKLEQFAQDFLERRDRGEVPYDARSKLEPQKRLAVFMAEWERERAQSQQHSDSNLQPA